MRLLVLIWALFAWHPLHVESVAWVSERKDVLSGFFWLLTIGAYARYVEKRTWQRYTLTLVFFALGLMSKPMVVTLPCVLLLLDWWPMIHEILEDVRRNVSPGLISLRFHNALADAIVAGGRFSCVAIGEHSRVCGEMSVVVVQGHANKAHDGFVGHSVLGRWSNLGAMTTTSNLKNSYGPVRVATAAGETDTGMQFLGSLVGDHAKTAIGTRLMTGTIVGAGANVFGDRSPDKSVPPFAWGDRVPFARYEREKFLDVAVHVLQRRGHALTDALRATLGAAEEETRRKKPKKKAKAPPKAKTKTTRGRRGR